MNFGKLLAKLNNDVRLQLRLLEKLKEILIVVRWSKYFYEICQKKNLMPKDIKKYSIYFIYIMKHFLYTIRYF